jgi:CHRD domain-containing protein
LSELPQGEKQMKRLYFGTALALATTLGMVGNALTKEDNRARMKANSTKGSGDFRAQLNDAKTGIEFELNYEDLAGTAPAASIQFGQPGVNGGKLADLCGGAKPACPATGPVTGTLAAADILAIAGQGIAAGDFDAALRAIRSGNTYVNIKTANIVDGEIRGQIRGRRFGQLNEDDED